jgi:hypothetical protein
MRTFLYARVSDACQTIEHQRSHAEAAGFKIDEVIADHGMSGVTTKLADRSGGRRLLDKVRKGDQVICRWVDRLGRNYDSLAFFAEQAPWLPEITPAALIGIAQLRRDHPDVWRQRASTGFRPFPRAMQPTWLDTRIRPKRETRPPWIDKIHHGRFKPLAGVIDDHAVDLVFTSPPYALQRNADYGGVAVANYPAFTVAWMNEVSGHLWSPVQKSDSDQPQLGLEHA